MINNADKYTIADIFMVDSQIKYIIPKFQREYIWNKDNWDALLDDIAEGDSAHFLGSIICINPGTDTLNPELEIIDGQQRLTTISLLFCAIYKLLKNKNIENDDDLKLIKWKLIQRRGANSLKLELSRQNNNFRDYQSILDEIDVKEFNDHANNKGNRKIYKAYRHFLNRLEEYGTKELIDLLVKIDRTLLVKIEVNSHSDAFMLFESLNNRGIPLSAIDLIKNKMLAELERVEIMSVDDAFNKWNKIINNLSDYAVQERFLRQYYNAFKYNKELIKVESITKATKSNLIKIYESLIDKRPEFIFEDLIKKSSIYHDLVLPEEVEVGVCTELKDELRDLVNVQAAPAYTLLLYLFSKDNEFDVEFYRDVVSFLVKYFIRRNITDFPNTRNLDQIFIDLIEKIEDNGKRENAKFIIEYLSDRDRMSSLKTFEEKLRGDIYELNVDATRFILSKIEENKGTRENYLDFWSRDKSNKLIWTVEHIFPEGRNIPASWVEMIAFSNNDKAKQIQEDYVHKLGNLTLTGYNQNLSNFDFAKKRDRKNQDDNYIGYKNGLFLNEDLREKNDWTKDDIIRRTEKIVNLALEIFKVE